MNRFPGRALVSVALVGIALAGGALVSACSAIVSPDSNRLRPPGDDSGMLDAGQVDGGDRDDGGMSCPTGCDDSIACTTDACGASGCTHATDDSACGPGERCNAVMGCVALRCTTSAECDDGLACNGTETCDPGSADPTGCVAGVAMVCDDGRSCTNDLCVDATGGCVFMPRNAMCDDGVSCTTDACDPSGAGDGCTHVGDDALCNDGFCFAGGRCNAMMGCVGSAPRDCSDGDPCDVEMCDAAASACVSAPLDVDMDGFAPSRVGTATCAGGTDCDDTRADVQPGAAEACGNGRDDNCNGMIDEGCVVVTPGDTCASAISLTSLPAFDPTAGMPTFPYGGTRSGTFSTFADDVRSDCSAMGGRDAFFTFETAGIVDVIIDTRPASGAAGDTVLTVLDSAGATCATTALVCNDDQDPGNGVGSRVFLHRVGTATATSPWARHTYYVYVEGYDAAVTGAFTINVQVRRAANDSCSTEPLNITGGGTVYGVGNALGGTIGTSGTCGGASAGEAILRALRPADGEHHSVTATSSTFSPVLYMRLWPCSSGTELDCDMAGGGSPATASISGSGLSSTDMTQHIFVDGMTGTSPHSYVVDYDP